MIMILNYYNMSAPSENHCCSVDFGLDTENMDENITVLRYLTNPLYQYLPKN